MDWFGRMTLPMFISVFHFFIRVQLRILGIRVYPLFIFHYLFLNYILFIMATPPPPSRIKCIALLPQANIRHQTLI